MKTEKEIKNRINNIEQAKAPLRNEYILAVDKEQQDFLASEIVRHDFMIMELKWVLKND